MWLRAAASAFTSAVALRTATLSRHCHPPALGERITFRLGMKERA
jgi:hypothetical protein